MKLKFFPTIETISEQQKLSYDNMFKQVLKWLSPDKIVSLRSVSVHMNGETKDFYWYIAGQIPNWNEGSGRKENYEKAIRNLQRLISKEPTITHFTISDNDKEFSYEPLNDRNFEDYEWKFDKLD